MQTNIPTVECPQQNQNFYQQEQNYSPNYYQSTQDNRYIPQDPQENPNFQQQEQKPYLNYDGKRYVYYSRGAEYSTSSR